MKTSELLKSSRQYVWDGVGMPTYCQTSFLCVAVGMAAGDFIEKDESCRDAIGALANKAHDRILERLDTCTSVSQWLFKNSPSCTWPQAVTAQRERLKWLAELIAEFEAKGD